MLYTALYITLGIILLLCFIALCMYIYASTCRRVRGESNCLHELERWERYNTDLQSDQVDNVMANEMMPDYVNNNMIHAVPSLQLEGSPLLVGDGSAFSTFRPPPNLQAERTPSLGNGSAFSPAFTRLIPVLNQHAEGISLTRKGSLNPEGIPAITRSNSIQYSFTTQPSPLQNKSLKVISDKYPLTTKALLSKSTAPTRYGRGMGRRKSR